jgi:DNA-binding transcriptional LysR family regulator
MRLRHIEVLYAIKKTGSISAAAEALSITQPAVSKIVKHAEAQIGFPLFRRLRGRLYPTDEAEILFSDIAKVQEALEVARRTARVLRDGLETRLRIACLPSLGMALVPRAVHTFRKIHPRVVIEIATRHEQEITDALLMREFDIGLSFGPHEEYSHLVPGIVSTLIATGEMVFVDHLNKTRLKDTGPIRLSKIDGKRMIGLNDTHYLGLMLKGSLERAGVIMTLPIQVQTYYIARNIVAAGAGCAVIDEFTAAAPPENVHIRLLDPPLRFGIIAHTREKSPLSKRASEFLTCLREVCQKDRLARD